MAKQLKRIFDPTVDQVDQTYIINAWHVSQSVDAFTGIDAYDISLSGSMAITGTLSADDDVFFSGLATSSQNFVVTIDASTGQLFYTASNHFSGSTDYVYSASFNTSSNVLSFFGSGSGFSGSVDLSYLTSSDYVYSASFNNSSAQLDFFASGSGFTGSVDLSYLTASDYVYSASFNSSSVQLDFFGSGSGFTGSVDLSYLTSSDYISNVTLDTDADGKADLLFTGVGDAFNGTASLQGLRDNGGGFTFRYSGSVNTGRSDSNNTSGSGFSAWPYNGSDGSPNKVISTTAPNLTSSGVYEWHFSDIGANGSSQYQNPGLTNVFHLMTSSITDDNQVLVRVYDDDNPRYEAYYTNVGPAGIGNCSSNGCDLILSMSFIGGVNFGAVSSIPFTFPSGTNPNSANVSFEIISSGGSGSVDYVYSSSFNSTSSVLNFFGSGSAFAGGVDLNSLAGSSSVDYVYSASFDSSSAQLDFFASGSGFTGSVDLSDLTSSDYVYSSSFNSTSSVLNFFSSGSAFAGGVDLSDLGGSGSVDYVYSASYNTASGEFDFFGSGSAYTGSVDLSYVPTSSLALRNFNAVTYNTSSFVLSLINADGGISPVSMSKVLSSSYAVTASYGPNLYNEDGTITDSNRSVTYGSINQALTFNQNTGSRYIINTVAGGGVASSFRTQGSGSTILSTFNVIMDELQTLNNGQIISVDSSGKLYLMNTSSISSSNAAPGTPLNSFQFNSASIFEGSALYYNSSSERVGLGIDSPARPFHISSSNAVPIRLESTTETSQDIQFFGNQASAAGLRIGSTGNNDYRVVQGTLSNINLYISSSGNTYLPNIVSSSQAKYLTYNTSSGEVTFHEGGGTTIYTGDGTITGNRLITFGSAGYFQITGSVSSFEVHSSEILFPLVTEQGGNVAEVCMIQGGGNGRLFYTSSNALFNAVISSSTNDTEVLFNDGGAVAGDNTFTWNKTSNYLTLRGNANAPALKLENSTPGTGLGTEFAELVARTSIYSADIAGIVFKGDGTFSGGDYPSRIEFTTTPAGSATPTTKMTIKESGRVGIGVVSPTNGFLEVNGNVSGTSIYASHNIVAYSDVRSKTNVTTIENALDKVDAIRGVTYNKVEDPDGIRYMGVIAQELQDVLPEVVAEGEDGNLAVAYGNIVGVLIEAVKELRAEIKELKEGK